MSLGISLKYCELSWETIKNSLSVCELEKWSLHPWDKAHLVMVYDLFNVLLDSDC